MGENLMALRTEIATLRSMSDFGREPEVTDGMVHLVTYLLLAIVIVSYPFMLYTEDTGCFQPWASISALAFYFTCDGLLSMQSLLERGPFDVRGDCVNVDNLLCSTEEASFFMIRADYAGENMEGGWDTALERRAILNNAMFQELAKQDKDHFADVDENALQEV